MSDDAPLITKYRPSRWDQVLGHREAIAQLKRATASPSHPRAYLLHGPSGVGKTTIARIIADCFHADILEIDAAMHTGVGEMRELIELAQHVPLSGGKRMIILDEAHMLSRSAFNSILKILEEPPTFLYIALCTTEPSKIPDTIQTRVYGISLGAVSTPEIEQLMLDVAEMEGWEVPNIVIHKCIEIGAGSPRRALKTLQALSGAQTAEEIDRILGLIDTAGIVEFCRSVIRGEARWTKIQPILASLDGDQWDAARSAACSYFAAVMKNSTNEAQARKMWDYILALSAPMSSFDPKVALLASIGRLVWGGDGHE